MMLRRMVLTTGNICSISRDLFPNEFIAWFDGVTREQEKYMHDFLSAKYPFRTEGTGHTSDCVKFVQYSTTGFYFFGDDKTNVYKLCKGLPTYAETFEEMTGACQEMNKGVATGNAEGYMNALMNYYAKSAELGKNEAIRKHAKGGKTVLVARADAQHSLTEEGPWLSLGNYDPANFAEQPAFVVVRFLPFNEDGAGDFFKTLVFDGMQYGKPHHEENLKRMLHGERGEYFESANPSI